MPSQARNVAICLLSQCLFSSLFLFSHWMQPLSGTNIFALRMLVTMAGLWAIVAATFGWQGMRAFLRERLGSNCKRWGQMLLGTPLLASQFWLFMWAPVNGEGVNVAMGYFMFPLAMVFAGWLWLKESLNRLQILVLLLAALGVVYELWATHAFSWTTLWVVLLYPPYYLIRRAMGIPPLQGLTFDLTLIFPFALLWLWSQGEVWHLLGSEPRYWLLLLGLGAVSAVAMLANLKSSATLPVNLFGMLSYVEPALLFLLSITVLGVAVQPSAYITYALIWLALLVLGVDAFRNWRRNMRLGLV